jgi:bifunctional non-homologous end joining protein LigD
VGWLPTYHREATSTCDFVVAEWHRLTKKYAVLLPALHNIECSCVIDGELCALDAHGRSRFQLLQNALNTQARLLYVVFDALFVDGKDIRRKPLVERKKILRANLPRDALLHYSEHVAEFGKREFSKAQRAHEEGVIAKRVAGLYYSGKTNARMAQVQGRGSAGGSDCRVH